MRQYKDSIALSLPIEEAMAIAEKAGLDATCARLTRIAQAQLAMTYPRSTLLGVDWTFATTPAEVMAWPLPHDCPDCQECKTLGIALLEKTKVLICLGTMHCEEPS
jgi:hypothetical protein